VPKRRGNATRPVWVLRPIEHQRRVAELSGGSNLHHVKAVVAEEFGGMSRQAVHVRGVDDLDANALTLRSSGCGASLFDV
jgi:hypothetical protein